MKNDLTNELTRLIARYGWQAVVTELAQIALDYSNPSAADTLLQAAFDHSRVA
jgi:hypothetical protein